jgi:hypothetical protein
MAFEVDLATPEELLLLQELDMNLPLQESLQDSLQERLQESGKGLERSSACRQGSAGLSSGSDMNGADEPHAVHCCNKAAAAGGDAAAAGSVEESTVAPDDDVLALLKRVFSMPQYPGE